jgi:hypothetical protein
VIVRLTQNNVLLKQNARGIISRGAVTVHVNQMRRIARVVRRQPLAVARTPRKPLVTRRSDAYGILLQAHAVKQRTMATQIHALDFPIVKPILPARVIANSITRQNANFSTQTI